MSIIDYPGLQTWFATAYRIYMFQENDSGAGSTIVNLGTPVGQMEEQSQPPLIIGINSDSARPLYTTEGAANAYTKFNGTNSQLVIRGSQTLYPFFTADPRIWTVAMKVRFANASSGGTEPLVDSNGITSSQIGFSLDRRVGNRIKLFITDGNAGVPLVEIDSSNTITDTLWHTVVAKSLGPGTDNVSLDVDGVVTLGTYSGSTAPATPSFADMKLGQNQSSSNHFAGDLSDLIIMDQAISTADQTDWLNTDTPPTLDPIVPGGGGFGLLIRSQKASITPGLLSARGVGG